MKLSYCPHQVRLWDGWSLPTGGRKILNRHNMNDKLRDLFKLFLLLAALLLAPASVQAGDPSKQNARTQPDWLRNAQPGRTQVRVRSQAHRSEVRRPRGSQV